MIKDIQHFYTEDGIPLIYYWNKLRFNGKLHIPTRPILTVSMRSKWYNDLYTVTIHEEGNYTVKPVVDLPPNIWHSDHIFKPLELQDWALDNSYDLDYNAYDYIVGRWVIRTEERF